MIGLQFSDLRLQFSDGVAKLGTRQTPFLRRFSQSSPSWSSLFTPMVSIMRPFLVGRERSRGGREISDFRSRMSVGGGVGVGVGVSDGVTFDAVEAMVEARACEVFGDSR